MSPAHPAQSGGTGRHRVDAASRVLDLVPDGPDRPPGVQEMS